MKIGKNNNLEHYIDGAIEELRAIKRQYQSDGFITERFLKSKLKAVKIKITRLDWLSKRKMIRYSYGSFENDDETTLVGFTYRTEKQLDRKLEKVLYTWKYDGIVPLHEVKELPDYVEIVY